MLAYADLERPVPNARDEAGNFLTISGTQRLRPFQFAYWTLAYHINPNSYVALNIVHAVGIIFKGIACFYLFRLLLQTANVQSRFPAFVAALITINYPVDAASFTFAWTAVQPAIAFLMLACIALIHFWRRYSNNRRAIWLLLGMWAALIASLFSYDGGYPLALCAPLMLLVFRPVDKRKLIYTYLLWLLPVIAALLYVALALSSGGNTYQGWVLQRSGLTNPSLGREIVEAIARGFALHFAISWVRGLSLLSTIIGYTAFTFVVAVATFAASLRSSWWSETSVVAQGTSYNKDLRLSRLIALIVLGLAGTFLGFATFLVTAYRLTELRIFVYAAPGAALALTCVLLLVASRLNTETLSRERWFALASCILLMLAGTWVLHQHAFYAGQSQIQRALLVAVLRSVPVQQPGSTLVVVDETGKHMGNSTLGASYLLQTATQYVAQDYNRQLALCSFDPHAGAFRTLPELQERCTFTAAGLSITRTNSTGEAMETVEYAADDLIVLRYTDEGATVLDSLPEAYTNGQAISGYNPRALFDPAATLPPRYDTLLSP